LIFMNTSNFFKDFFGFYILFSFIGVPLINQIAMNVPPEKTKEQLEIILSKEKKKFNLNDKNIEIVFNDSIRNSCTRMMDSRGYLINLSKKQRNEDILRHEFYHVAKGHCDRYYKTQDIKGFFDIGKRFFDYTFVMEPTAAIYSLTGIR
jgi:hypothetical protein